MPTGQHCLLGFITHWWALLSTTRDKMFLQNFNYSRDGPEKSTETRHEMKEHKKTTQHCKKYTADVG